MGLAQKLHSESDMERNRVEFYKRFENSEADRQITVVEPNSAITCENYYTLQQRGRVKISCRACRDRRICLTAT